MDEAHERAVTTNILMGFLLAKARLIMPNAIDAEQLGGGIDPFLLDGLTGGTAFTLLKANQRPLWANSGDSQRRARKRHPRLPHQRRASTHPLSNHSSPSTLLLPPLAPPSIVLETLPAPLPGVDPGRKVVIVANTAKASLPIGGIPYIVNSEFATPKILGQDCETGFEWHTVQGAHWTTRRAGRTWLGKGFRVDTEEEIEEMLGGGTT